MNNGGDTSVVSAVKIRQPINEAGNSRTQSILITIERDRDKQMYCAGWDEVGTLTKHNRKGKLRDTFRIFQNQFGWCKGRRDETGKEFWFNSEEELQTKLDSLLQLNYKVASEINIANEITSRFSAVDD